jgi:chemotaxis protein methyltransferase WspC
LFIGPAEGSLLTSSGMRPLGIAQAFAFVRQDEPVPAPPMPMPVPLPLPPIPRSTPAPRPATPALPATAARQGVQEATVLLGEIAVLANAGKSIEARLACERYLRDHPPQAQVFYWLGLLSDVGGNTLDAQGFYRKALYLEPQHPEALAHLAMLLAARGDADGARRLQVRALRAQKEPKA